MVFLMFTNDIYVPLKRHVIVTLEILTVSVLIRPGHTGPPSTHSLTHD